MSPKPPEGVDHHLKPSAKSLTHHEGRRVPAAGCCQVHGLCPEGACEREAAVLARCSPTLRVPAWPHLRCAYALLQPSRNSHAPCVLPACVEQRTRVPTLSVRPRIHLLTRLVRFGHVLFAQTVTVSSLPNVFVKLRKVGLRRVSSQRSRRLEWRAQGGGCTAPSGTCMICVLSSRPECLATSAEDEHLRAAGGGRHRHPRVPRLR